MRFCLGNIRRAAVRKPAIIVALVITYPLFALTVFLKLVLFTIQDVIESCEELREYFTEIHDAVKRSWKGQR